MRADEIDRFFQVRVVGPDSLAMAIHVRATGRLIGTCAFSQLDGDNGSALFHITIGEKDAWGHGYGTESTGLMLDHAFGDARASTGSRCRCSSSTNARSGRTRRCGFVIEGRARESIWRDGQWWDELHMSVLAAEWARGATASGAAGRAGAGRRGRGERRGSDGVVRRGARDGWGTPAVASTGPAAEAARAEFRE